MKTTKLLFFISAYIFISCSHVLAGIAVQAVGQAKLEGADAEEKALNDSLKIAVDKSLGSVSGSVAGGRDFTFARDKILSRAEAYIIKYEKLREWREGETFNLKIKAEVDVQRMEEDFRSLLKSVAAKLDYPVIAFVLTAFEKREKSKQKQYIEGQILIDAFQEQFISKGFDIIAADEARQFAANHTGRLALIASGDRREMARYARKIGANYVARGELQVNYKGIDTATGANKYAGSISCEIIESATKDVVAAYSNTVTKQFPDKLQALAVTMQTAARNAAEKLSRQTLNKWMAIADVGKSYSITIKNISSHRKQSRKVEQALAKYGKIRNARYDHKEKEFTMDVIFKGTGKEIEDILFNEPELAQFKNFDLIESSGNKLCFSF